ncbi:MAG TPA: DUF1697 domain-containing protein [Bacteroidetes bacterium]|nr:DUF1697 domain-containing protein [Bacteroidota bacterium]
MEDLRYVVLLRGINVGGNNIIKMTDLKASFEKMGFQNVSTYIQSGNVLFSSDSSDKEALSKKIEQALSHAFNYKSKVVLVSQKNLSKVVDEAPPGFGIEPDLFRYDVLFLKPPLTPENAVQKLTLREGVDKVWQGDGVLYFSRLIAKAGQSYLNKLVSMSIYKEMTVRNWNTTSKLLELMDN